MNRTRFTAIAFAVTTATAALSACHRETLPIHGTWAVDIERTVRNAERLGATSRDIQRLRQSFTGGYVTIDASRIKASVSGANGAESFPYTVQSKDGACVNLIVNGSARPHRYCVEDERLEVRDPDTPLLVVHRRA